MFLASIVFVVLTHVGTASAESPPNGLADMPGRAVGPDHAPCLQFADVRSLLPSASPDAPLDCESGLQNDLSLPMTLSYNYNEQKMDRASVTGPHNISKYLSDESNSLARSVGTFAFPGEHTRAEFELDLSHANRPGILDYSRSAGMAARVGLKGEWGRTHYWAEYGYSNKDFTDLGGATPRDQAGVKVGAEWNLDVFKPRLEFTHFHNNVAADPSLAQTTTTKGLVAFDFGGVGWPRFTFAYGGELKETASKPNGKATEGFLTHTFTGTLSYQQEAWETYPHLYVHAQAGPVSCSIEYGCIRVCPGRRLPADRRAQHRAKSQVLAGI